MTSSTRISDENSGNFGTCDSLWPLAQWYLLWLFGSQTCLYYMFLHPPTELCSRPRELSWTWHCCFWLLLLLDSCWLSRKKKFTISAWIFLWQSGFLACCAGVSSFAARVDNLRWAHRPACSLFFACCWWCCLFLIGSGTIFSSSTAILSFHSFHFISPIGLAFLRHLFEIFLRCYEISFLTIRVRIGVVVISTE